MGLVILPVALVLAAIWIGVTVALAILCWQILSAVTRQTVAVSGAGAIFLSSCTLPNASGIADEIEFQGMKADCGWEVRRTVSEVDAVFAAQTGEKANGNSRVRHFAEDMARIYDTAEVLDNSEVAPFTNGAATKADPSAMQAGTARYGVVFSTSIIGNYRREQALVLDRQSGDVLARNIEYWPATASDDRTVIDDAISFITIQPGRNVCQVLAPTPYLSRRVEQVLVPRRKT